MRILYSSINIGSISIAGKGNLIGSIVPAVGLVALIALSIAIIIHKYKKRATQLLPVRPLVAETEDNEMEEESDNDYMRIDETTVKSENIDNGWPVKSRKYRGIFEEHSPEK